MQSPKIFASLLLCFQLTFAAGPADPRQIGRPLPLEQIATTGGYKIELAQYKGKTILLAMVALDCQHCIETLAILKRIQTEFAPQGLQVIATATEAKPFETIPDYIKKNSPNYPMGMVEPPQFMKLAAIGPEVHPVVPVLIFVDTTGIVRYQYFGDHADMKNPEPMIRKNLSALFKAPALKKK